MLKNNYTILVLNDRCHHFFGLYHSFKSITFPKDDDTGEKKK